MPLFNPPYVLLNSWVEKKMWLLINEEKIVWLFNNDEKKSRIIALLLYQDKGLFFSSNVLCIFAQNTSSLMLGWQHILLRNQNGMLWIYQDDYVRQIPIVNVLYMCKNSLNGELSMVAEPTCRYSRSGIKLLCWKTISKKYQMTILTLKSEQMTIERGEGRHGES